YTDLADFFADLHHGSQHIVCSLVTAYHFQQFHHVGRTEEVHAHNVLRTFGGFSNHVHVLIRGVGSQDAARFADGVQFAKHFFFHIRVFEYSFDDQIHITDIVVAGCAGDQTHTFFHIGFGQLALLHRDAVVLSDHTQSTLQRLDTELNQLDRNTYIGKTHGNTA